jgi:hypothetical protein
MIVAKQSDQTVRAFCGTYTLRRANVPPFDQFGWRIYTASIKATASVEPGSNAAKAQLASCP